MLGKWLYKILSRHLTKDGPPHNANLCDFGRIMHEVRAADVLLIEGRNRISKVIKHVTFSPWTHAGLYIGRLHDIEDPHIRERIHHFYQGAPSDPLVIETIVGQGTVINSIKTYNNHHIRLCRPSGLTHEDVQRVIAKSSERLGRAYNIRQFLDLGRLYLKSKLIPPRFRSRLFNYKAGEAVEDICSTMIAEAFMSVNFPILPLIRKAKDDSYEMIHRNPKLFIPSDFDYSPYFDIIKYPIFDLNAPRPYHNLPWNQSAYSNDEMGVQLTHEKPEENQP